MAHQEEMVACKIDANVKFSSVKKPALEDDADSLRCAVSVQAASQHPYPHACPRQGVQRFPGSSRILRRTSFTRLD